MASSSILSDFTKQLTEAYVIECSFFKELGIQVDSTIPSTLVGVIDKIAEIAPLLLIPLIALASGQLTINPEKIVILRSLHTKLKEKRDAFKDIAERNEKIQSLSDRLSFDPYNAYFMISGSVNSFASFIISADPSPQQLQEFSALLKDTSSLLEGKK